jgi:SPP1 family predicted phage head-tail adaptor
MNIGALDRFITIQTPTEVVSSTTGERTMTWAELDEVWATVTYPSGPLSGNEGLEQGRETAVTPVEFMIWFRTDVTEKMRIYYDSTYFNILRINKVGGRDEMLKIVTEKKY